MNKKTITIVIIGMLLCISFSITPTLGLYTKKITQISENESKPVLPTVKMWKKTYGYKGFEALLAVQQTNDGGYIFTGFTDSKGAGGADVWLVKVDENGLIEWERTFGGSGDEFSRDVIQSSDGGYLIAAKTKEVHLWLIKVSSNGVKEWSKTIHINGIEEGRALIQTSDGGYLIVGENHTALGGSCYTIGRLWMQKVDANGNPEWTRSFGDGYAAKWANDVKETNDGGFIVIGTQEIIDKNNRVTCWKFVLIKTDKNGNLQWSKQYGSSDKYSQGISIDLTQDGGYILTGCKASTSTPSVEDIWLIKTDANGNKIWDKTFDREKSDSGFFVQQTNDGGYILTGATGDYTKPDNCDVWLIKTNKNGDIEWDKTFGGYEADWGNEVQQTSDGGYIIGGCTNSYGSGSEDAWLIKTDEYGNVKKFRSIRSINSILSKFLVKIYSLLSDKKSNHYSINDRSLYDLMSTKQQLYPDPIFK